MTKAEIGQVMGTDLEGHLTEVDLNIDKISEKQTSEEETLEEDVISEEKTEKVSGTMAGH